MGINIDAMQQKKKQRGGKGWKPKAGPNDIFVLPPTSEYFDKDLDYFARDFNMHFFQQEGYDTEVSRCLRDKREYCPACEMYGKYNDFEEDPGLADLAQDVSQVSRWAMNILDIEDPNGVEHYVCGYTVHNNILELAASGKWGDIFNPAEGHVITVKLTPANESRSGYNQYTVQPDPQKTNVEGMLPDNYREQLDELPHALPEYMETSDMKLVLSRMGFPIDEDKKPTPQSPSVSPKTASGDDGTVGPVAESQVDGPSPSEGQQDGPRPVPVGADDDDEESG